MEVGVDGSIWKDLNLPVGVEMKLRERYAKKWEVQQIVALSEAKRLAQGVNQKPHYHIDGIGECVARIPADAYFYWMARKGIGCWLDKTFIREYIRDNPEVRVNSKSRKAMVTV
jgi:hypothetical protein